MGIHAYDEQYQAYFRDKARRSAEVIVPLVLDMVQPSSVVDVGCGTGAWLAVMRSHGVCDILGVDGPYIGDDQLQIPREYFLPFDLSRPLRLDRRFDLVLSLEVAEHLPAEAADLFIDTLVDLGPIVMFSAAVPFQGGEHHVNEQWPEYWAAHFAGKGYVLFDCLRGTIWQHTEIEWWYRQNILLYVDAGYLRVHPELAMRLGELRKAPLSLIHPDKYLEMVHDLSLKNQNLQEQSLRLRELGDDWIRLSHENRELKEAISRMQASLSWRVTAPLRALKKTVYSALGAPDETSAGLKRR